MSGDVTVQSLRKVALLQAFSDAELSELILLGKTVTFEPYTNVVIEGEASWGMYFIMKGQVGIFKVNRLSGNVYDVGQLQEGSFFGEMSLVDSQPRSATVQSLTDCRLFLIDKAGFQKMVNSSTELKLRFLDSCIQQLVGRLRSLNDDYVVSQYQLWQKALALGSKNGKDAA
jgi:CRP/FNR family cyclic AMP-dependent transcriptional regulator